MLGTCVKEFPARTVKLRVELTRTPADVLRQGSTISDPYESRSAATSWQAVVDHHQSKICMTSGRFTDV